MGEFVTPEVGVAVAVTSVVLHPKVRAFARRGMVLGLAGGLGAWSGIKEWASGLKGAGPLTTTALSDLHHEAEEVHRGKGRNKHVPAAP